NKSTILLKGEMKLIEIEYREKIDPALQIETYQNELIQVIISILKNSVDAFKESSVQNPYIEVTTSLEKNHLMIYIEDNAGGISPETLAHVFEPYFSTKSKNGTGLGLYMCKTIVEEHLHGKITIISEDGYTRAVIELPYAIRDHINTKRVYTS
ncbi:MAG: ATP-binding protein, partial [Epsilonproteobacteria bacterium]|nr:ATP-binding protein [Campylobacterota bacterium]